MKYSGFKKMNFTMFIIIFLTLLFYVKTTDQKPGVCPEPAPQEPRMCAKKKQRSECKQDLDCANDQKCCKMECNVLKCLVPLQDPSIEICELTKEIGPCKASIPRFYYNSEKQKCEEFIYGGCGGNANNFETQEECEYMCV